MGTTKLSFPGLGIGEFTVDSVAFRIGSLEIAWYAIIITLGMVAAICYAITQSKKIGISSDEILDFVIFAIPIGIIGARLYFVFSKLDQYSSLGEILNIRNGGLAIYGGLIAGTATVLVMCRIKHIKFMALADCVMPGVILAQAIGRWGNFMNGEAFGAQTEIFCRMGIVNHITDYKLVYVHPTFLYESLWNIIGFLLIFFLVRRLKQYDGQIFIITCAWYGLGRMLIEGLRADSLYTHIGSLTFRTSQVLAGAILIVCISALIYFAIKKPSGEFYKKEQK